MENIIGLKELRYHTERYIQQVKRGKSFLVMRRSIPVFKLSPPEKEEAWETVIDFTKIKRGGVALKDLLSRI